MKKRMTVVALMASLTAGCAGTDSGGAVRSGTGPSPASASDSPNPSTENSTEESSSITPATSDLLSIQGKFDIPDGVDGALSIVLTGPPNPDAGTLPVVIRNRTAQSLSTLEVTGTGRDGSGELIGSGSSQGFAPAVVQPGEWAVGYVFFDGAKLAEETKYDLTATGDEPDDFLSSVDVDVVEVSATSGQFGDQLIGILSNPTDAEVGGPISVMVGCFDGAGGLISTQTGFADGDSLPPEGTSSFSVDLFDDPCKNWAIGASGYDF